MSNITTELHNLGASELAEAIRKRSLSSREAVQGHLDRIAQVNPTVNALTTVLADEALAAADAADAALAAGKPAGPLHGVPFTVKENIDVAGSATTWGSAALAQQAAPDDAPQVAALRAAGAIPIARSNMPDFALRWHTDSGVAGETRNPHDPSLTPGGSSGGEAAALATGMTPLGLGNDLGGSLRWPAQCCGISSLRPGLGRVPSGASTIPTDPTMAIQLFNTQGPMARRVADLRLAFELMRQPSGRDPLFSPVTPAPQVAKPRVAVVRDPAGQGVDPAIAAAVDRAAAALSAAGYEVDEVEPPGIAEAGRGWGVLLAADLAALEPLIVPLMSDSTRRFFEIASGGWPTPDAPAIVNTFVERHSWMRAWAEFQAERPLVLAPISCRPPFAPGADLDPTMAEPWLEAMRMVVSVNFLGLPAAAVAIPGQSPTAVQVIAPRFGEELALDAAEAIEQAVGAPAPIDPRS